MDNLQPIAQSAQCRLQVKCTLSKPTRTLSNATKILSNATKTLSKRTKILSKTTKAPPRQTGPFPRQPFPFQPLPRQPKAVQRQPNPFKPILKISDFNSQYSHEVEENMRGMDTENNLVTFVQFRAAAVPFLLKGVSRC